MAHSPFASLRARRRSSYPPSKSCFVLQRVPVQLQVLTGSQNTMAHSPFASLGARRNYKYEYKYNYKFNYNEYKYNYKY